MDLMRERQADRLRADAMAIFQAGAAIMGEKRGVEAFNKWLKDLG